jgi:subtilisin family serine protease
MFERGRLLAVVSWLLVAVLSQLAGQDVDPIDEAFGRDGKVCVFVHLDPTADVAISGLPSLERGRVAEHLRREDAVIAQLPSGTFEVRYRLRYSPTMVLVLTHREALASLRALPEVRTLQLDAEGSGALDESRPLVGGDAVSALGVTGNGVVVALLDSGVDSAHQALAGAILHEHHYLAQGTDQGPTARDEHGHGSHVTGVVASNGSGEVPRGLAPGVGLVIVRVLNSSNRGWVSDWVAGLEHVIALHEAPNGLAIDVVNMSLATTAGFREDCNESFVAFHAASEAARQHGIVLVAASGNNGSTTQLTSPACLPSVFSVGMSTKTTPEAIVRLSNRNEHLDLLAPGENIVSVGAGGTTATMTGTSFASPHVAAAAALLLELDPSLHPVQILEILQETGTPIEDSGIGISFPRLDVLAAVSRVASDCDDDGTIDLVALRDGLAEDCNANRVPDACDLAAGYSQDADGDNQPDECDGRPFRRGDCDGDGGLLLTDVLVIVNYLFLGSSTLPCLEAADVNNDSIILVTDAIRLAGYLFLSRAAPAAPGPGPSCGFDTDPRDSAGDLGCVEYSCF